LVTVITWWFRNKVTSSIWATIIISHTSVIITNDVFIVTTSCSVTEILSTFVFIIAIVFLIDASSLFIARVISTDVSIAAVNVGI
jgi:hypothetical protein